MRGLQTVLQRGTPPGRRLSPNFASPLWEEHETGCLLEGAVGCAQHPPALSPSSSLASRHAGPIPLHSIFPPATSVTLVRGCPHSLCSRARARHPSLKVTPLPAPAGITALPCPQGHCRRVLSTSAGPRGCLFWVDFEYPGVCHFVCAHTLSQLLWKVLRVGTKSCLSSVPQNLRQDSAPHTAS